MGLDLGDHQLDAVLRLKVFDHLRLVLPGEAIMQPEAIENDAANDGHGGKINDIQLSRNAIHQNTRDYQERTEQDQHNYFSLILS